MRVGAWGGGVGAVVPAICSVVHKDASRLGVPARGAWGREGERVLPISVGVLRTALRLFCLESQWVTIAR